MKINKILKTIGAIAAMGVAYVAAGKFGDTAKESWDEATAKDDNWDDDDVEIFDLPPEDDPKEKTEETEDE